ncbi:Na+/H+ antiporter subunit E [Phytoactinopolyspora mesophila]|nr:Na+/H+ antiporter subunit E [Phytoactinopolyspora mesophila]
MIRRTGQELARIPRLLVFVGYFAYALVVASLWVAWDVLTPRQRLRAGIVAMPMQGRTPMEMTLMANLVSLTPGTLSVTINAEPNVLYVHGMYQDDAEAFRQELQDFERRMLSAVRIHDRPSRTGDMS